MFARFERGNRHRGMHVGRRADPDDIEIVDREEVRPILHRRGLREVFLAEFLRAPVGGIRNGDDIHLGVALQRGQMALPNDFPRSDDSDAQFVVVVPAH